jgi:hypothetical protein
VATVNVPHPGPQDTSAAAIPARTAEIVLAHPSDASASAQSTARPVAASVLAADGIPAVALAAYQHAARLLARSDPRCGLPWQLLAAIGRVESDHGRFGGATLLRDGTSAPRVIGIRLDGSRSATVPDTDNGRLDGDPVFDRAVGPMQFIPGTWRTFAADGDGNGVRNPFDMDDAALAAATYLCAAGGDVRTSAGLARAVLSYNHSRSYLEMVVALERQYARGGTVIVPILPGTPVRGSVPPADAGPPRGVPSTAPAPRSTSAHPTTSHARPSTSSSARTPSPTASRSPTCPVPSSTAASTTSSSSPGASTSVSTSASSSTSSSGSPVPSSSSSPTPSSTASDTGTTSPAPTGTPTCPAADLSAAG